MDPWLHSPGLGSEEAWLDCDHVVALFESAYPDYCPLTGSDGDWG